MKFLNLLISSFLLVTPSLWSQKNTSSKAFLAQQLATRYGVRTDATEAILRIYEEKGYDTDRCRSATEQLLKAFAQSSEKLQKQEVLSEATRHQLAIHDAPTLVNALEWDLFAQNHYLITPEFKWPTGIKQNNNAFWYGIHPPALRALVRQLEKNESDFRNAETLLDDLVDIYEQLIGRLKRHSEQEAVFSNAIALLEKGRLEEARQLIETDYQRSYPPPAYKSCVFGHIQELHQNYEDAAKGYKAALQADNSNAIYHQLYARNEYRLAHFDIAIQHYKAALQIDLETFGKAHPVVARDCQALANAYSASNRHKNALKYHEKALKIHLDTFGQSHPAVAADYNYIGMVWDAKLNYSKAIKYYEKALEIDLIIFGENHPNVAREFNNLGTAWASLMEYDKAIDYYERCQKIWDQYLPSTHSNQIKTAQNLSRAANTRGMEFFSLRSYQKALPYFKKAFLNTEKADDALFALTCLNNAGAMLKHLHAYEEALYYLEIGLEKAVQVNTRADTIKQLMTRQKYPQGEIDDVIRRNTAPALIRRIKYHKVCCLKALQRNEEALQLARPLWQEGVATHDTHLLEELKAEGFTFKEN
jgi:tetratricopeptide (TPR) repeat protein